MNSREKGKVGERQAAAEIRRLFGTNARRSVQHCGRAGDADLVDAIPGCHCEVKSVKRIAALRFHEQAVRDARDGSTPIVVMKENRSQWFVLLTLDDLAKLIRSNRCEASVAVLEDRHASQGTDRLHDAATDQAALH